MKGEFLTWEESYVRTQTKDNFNESYEKVQKNGMK